jgi:hypothetical protein
MTKLFSILSGRFRHGDKIEQAFVAVCVVCQFKLENEMPLYNILVQKVIDADSGDESSTTTSSSSSDSSPGWDEEEDDGSEESADDDDDSND